MCCSTSGDTDFTIQVYDAHDQLVNDGRTYSFILPGGCANGCPDAYTPVTYTTADGTAPTGP